MGDYNIPISASVAESTATPQNFRGETYFVFNSAGATSGGGATGQQANPYAPAVATSSAAQGQGSSARSSAQLGGPPANLPIFGTALGLSTPMLIGIGAGTLLVLGLAAYIYTHRKK